MDYRSLNKLKNTYVDQLPDHVHPRSGHIHSRFQQTATATGRLSSDNPNMQNIPIRSAEGQSRNSETALLHYGSGYSACSGYPMKDALLQLPFVETSNECALTWDVRDQEVDRHTCF